MKCDYCRPHADPRKQRLCHVGTELFNGYRQAAIRHAELCGMLEPPVVSVAEAKKARDEARTAYRAHTDGG